MEHCKSGTAARIGHAPHLGTVGGSWKEGLLRGQKKELVHGVRRRVFGEEAFTTVYLLGVTSNSQSEKITVTGPDRRQSWAPERNDAALVLGHGQRVGKGKLRRAKTAAKPPGRSICED